MLKIFLMTKNEIELLEDWIKYHGYLFGFENIHVVDGSDDDRVFEIYNRYKPLGIHIHYSPKGLNDLAKELTELMHAHKGTNSFLIKLDTDEFLAYTPKFDPGLRSINNIYNTDICTNNFRQFFAELPVTGQRYKASLTVWSIPRNDVVSKPCRELTEFTPLQLTQLKTFFHSDSFVSVDLGCHNGVSTNNEGFIETALTFVHYHSISVEDSARRAKQVLLSHEYINKNDSITEQQQKLKCIRSKGGVLSYHKIDFYLNYLDSIESGYPINPDILNKQHAGFKPTGPSSEMTLIRDTLNAIDRDETISNTTAQHPELTTIINTILLQGEHLYNIGKSQAAKSLFQVILDMQPEHPEANHNMGVLLVETSNPAVSLDYFERAVSGAPNNTRYWLSYIQSSLIANKADIATKRLETEINNGLDELKAKEIIDQIQLYLKLE